MDYGLLIKKSWDIAFKNRLFWFFGVLASGLSSVSYLNATQFGSDYSPNEINSQLPAMFSSITSETWVTLAIIAAIVILLVLIISSFIGTWAYGALLSAIHKRNFETPTFRSMTQDGLRSWWKLLLINSVIGVITLTAILLLLLPILFALIFKQTILAIIFGVIALVLFIFIILVVSTIGTVATQLASRMFIHRGGKTYELLKASVRLINKNRSKVALTWALAYGLSIAASIGIVLVLLPVIGVVAFLFFLNVYVGIGALLPAIAIALAIGGLINTFTIAYWSLFYEHLAAQEG